MFAQFSLGRGGVQNWGNMLMYYLNALYIRREVLIVFLYSIFVATMVYLTKYAPIYPNTSKHCSKVENMNLICNIFDPGQVGTEFLFDIESI